MLNTLAVNSQTERKAEDAHGLDVGTKAPLFKALDTDSNLFSLENTLVKSPVVLVFLSGILVPGVQQTPGTVAGQPETD